MFFNQPAIITSLQQQVAVEKTIYKCTYVRAGCVVYMEHLFYPSKVERVTTRQRPYVVYISNQWLRNQGTTMTYVTDV